MFPDHNVYVTDWHDARNVPLSAGDFDLEDHVDTLIGFIQFLGPDINIIAVCQPSVSVLTAAAIMAEDNDPFQPKTMTLMGGPIDTRVNPTAVNWHAENHDISWFKQNVISRVPYPHAGAMRSVYSGFLQLSGFYVNEFRPPCGAHVGLYNHLIDGDVDSAHQHRSFMTNIYRLWIYRLHFSYKLLMSYLKTIS